MSELRRRSARLSSVKSVQTPQETEVSASAPISGQAGASPGASLSIATSAIGLGGAGFGDFEDTFGDSELSSISDGEDDYASSSKKRKAAGSTTSNATRPAAHSQSKKPPKQAKTTLAFFQNKKEQKLRMKGFPFTSFPLDVVLEILAHVTPQDLVSLLLLNKDMNRILTDTSAVATWKAVRKAFSVPGPSPGLSELRWARFLFGSDRCQACSSRRGTITTCYVFLRRFCSKCYKERTVSQAWFTRRFPFHDIEIQELIPFGTRGYNERKVFCVDDIEDMAKTLGQYTHDISLRKPNARQNLDSFKTARKARVEEIVQHASKMRRWQGAHFWEEADAEKEQRRQLFDDVKTCLLEIGYKEVDIEALRGGFNSKFKGITKFTPANWSRMLPELETMIVDKRMPRLLKDHSDLVQERIQALTELYNETLRSQRASEWMRLPVPTFLSRQNKFRQIVFAEEERTVTKDDYREAMSTVAEDAQTQLAELEQTLSARLAQGCASNGELALDSAADNLRLAIAVFSSSDYSWSQSDVVISGDEVIRQWSETGSTYCYVHRKALDVAIFLVRLAGLDPVTATARDMDNLGLEFACSGNCTYRAKTTAGKVFSWRGAVRHAVKCGSDWSYFQKGVTTTRLRLLTNQEKDFSQTKPPLERPEQLKIWTCNHCDIHLDAWEMFATVTEHALNMHHIAAAQEGTDIVIRPGKWTLQTDKSIPTAALPSEPPKPPKVLVKDHQCLLCPGPRRFDVQGVCSHIKAKHKVEPTMNQNYRKVAA